MSLVTVPLLKCHVHLIHSQSNVERHNISTVMGRLVVSTLVQLLILAVYPVLGRSPGPGLVMC